MYVSSRFIHQEARLILSDSLFSLHISVRMGLRLCVKLLLYIPQIVLNKYLYPRSFGEKLLWIQEN